MNWDDLRYVLAVADHGSVSSAARELGVTHATVLRHVASFEEQHGGKLFDKDRTGYRVRPDRQRVIEAARDVSEAVGAVDRLMHGARAPLRGRVRVSSTDSLCRFVLPAALAQLRTQAPQLDLDLFSSNLHVDIGRLQADITVRPTPELPDDMVGERTADLVFAAYGTPEAGDRWLGLQGPLARSHPAQWMQRSLDSDLIKSGSDSFVVLAEMARLGLGIAVLPIFVGDNTPGLQRRVGVMPEISVPVWVATHEDLSESPRIRLVRNHLAGFLRDQTGMFAGTG